MARQLLIGLTGVYCAGKNFVGRLLEARGFAVLDVDTLGHQATELEKDAIVRRFGPSILAPDGTVDRKVLGGRVFGNPAELADLEGIIHPAANRLTEEWIRDNSDKPRVINAALLHRSTSFGKLDFIILVKAPFITRLLRAVKRDHLSVGQLIMRFKSQGQFIPQYLKGNADIRIVENRGYFSLGSRRRRRKLQGRIDEILSLEGMAR